MMIYWYHSAQLNNLYALFTKSAKLCLPLILSVTRNNRWIAAVLTERNFCLPDTHHQWICCYWTHSLSNGHYDHQTISTHGSCPDTHTHVNISDTQSLFAIAILDLWSSSKKTALQRNLVCIRMTQKQNLPSRKSRHELLVNSSAPSISMASLLITDWSKRGNKH